MAAALMAGPVARVVVVTAQVTIQLRPRQALRIPAVAVAVAPELAAPMLVRLVVVVLLSCVSRLIATAVRQQVARPLQRMAITRF